MSVIDLETKCPAPRQHTDFLAGVLDEAVLDKFVQHVELCPDCQKRLEELSAPEPEAILTDSQRQAWSTLLDQKSTVGKLNQPFEKTTATSTDSLAALATGIFNRLDIPAVLPALPGYQVLEPVAAGGMGTIYRARHERLGRDVAIKVMQKHATGGAAVRFEREMAAVGMLEHNHIVRAYDAGEVDGVPYIVMELLDGSDLSGRLKTEGPLSVVDACSMVRQAALGLQAAHDAGLIHHDIKPSNLMLTKDGVIKVLDLGLVGTNSIEDREAEHGSVSREPVIMGSLDYIAPEQARSDDDVDHRADIYSLGCTLFALLTGRAPFADGEFNTPAMKLLAHATAARPDARQHRSDIPDDLAEFIRRMMATESKHRPDSAADVAAVLAAYCPEHPAAGTTSAGEPPQSWSRGIALAGFGGLLLLLGVIIIKFKDGTSMRIETDRPVESIKLNPDATGKAEAELHTGPNKELYPNLVRSMQGFQGPINAFCFGRTTSEAFSINLTGRVVRWDLQTGEGTEVYQVEAKIDRVSPVATLSPDGRFLFFGTPEGLCKLNLESREPEWTAEGGSHRWCEFIPDSDQFLHGRHRSTAIRNHSDGSIVNEFRFASSQRPAFTKDKRLMAFRNHKAAETAMLAPLAPRGESDRTVLEDDGVKPTSFAFASDGKHLIGLGETFTIIWDVATKKIVRKYHTPRRASQEFLHRVGDADLFATLRGTLRDQLVIWNPVTGEEQFNFRVPSTFRFVVSSDGKHLLTSDYVTDRELYSEGLRLWTLTPPTESNAGTERGAAKPDRSD